MNFKSGAGLCLIIAWSSLLVASEAPWEKALFALRPDSSQELLEKVRELIPNNTRNRRALAARKSLEIWDQIKNCPGVESSSAALQFAVFAGARHRALTCEPERPHPLGTISHHIQRNSKRELALKVAARIAQNAKKASEKIKKNYLEDPGKLKNATADFNQSVKVVNDQLLKLETVIQSAHPPIATISRHPLNLDQPDIQQALAEYQEVYRKEFQELGFEGMLILKKWQSSQVGQAWDGDERSVKVIRNLRPPRQILERVSRSVGQEIPKVDNLAKLEIRYFELPRHGQVTVGKVKEAFTDYIQELGELKESAKAVGAQAAHGDVPMEELTDLLIKDPLAFGEVLAESPHLTTSQCQVFQHLSQRIAEDKIFQGRVQTAVQILDYGGNALMVAGLSSAILSGGTSLLATASGGVVRGLAQAVGRSAATRLLSRKIVQRSIGALSASTHFGNIGGEALLQSFRTEEARNTYLASEKYCLEHETTRECIGNLAQLNRELEKMDSKVSAATLDIISEAALAGGPSMALRAKEALGRLPALFGQSISEGKRWQLLEKNLSPQTQKRLQTRWDSNPDQIKDDLAKINRLCK